MVAGNQPTLNTKTNEIYNTYMTFCGKNSNNYVFKNYKMYFLKDNVSKAGVDTTWLLMQLSLKHTCLHDS